MVSKLTVAQYKVNNIYRNVNISNTNEIHNVWSEIKDAGKFH